jgi:deoxyadenosine/deoxycytidine kinase
MHSHKPVIISLEGNIGAGKTTLFEQLRKEIESEEVIFLREPVDLWEKIRDPVSGENILEKFYQDTAKYSLAFQILAYSTRLTLLKEAIRAHPAARVVICERSLDADRNIFAKMLHSDGKMEDIEFQIYQSFYRGYSEDYQLTGVIYIDASPETCLSRIHLRNRPGEEGIPLEYLKKSQDFHETWLEKGEDLGNTRVLRINTDIHLALREYREAIMITWLERIKEFLQTLRGRDIYYHKT